MRKGFVWDISEAASTPHHHHPQNPGQCGVEGARGELLSQEEAEGKEISSLHRGKIQTRRDVPKLSVL